MYKNKVENVEVYFICYKKEEMDLVETYYDEVLDIHCWYFNAYLAYKYWKRKYKNLEIGEMSKNMLTVAASRYLIYCIENKVYKNEKEHQRILKDMKKIELSLQKIINENDCLINLGKSTK